MLGGAEWVWDIGAATNRKQKQLAQMKGALCRICHGVGGKDIFHYRIKRVIRSAFHMACQLFCKLQILAQLAF